MKKCSTCKDPKELEDFPPDKRARDGRQARCKSCCAKAAKKWRDDNPKKSKASNRKHYRNNREKRLADGKRYAQENPKKYRANLKRLHLMRNYGLTVEDYNEMVEAQEGNCAVCGEAFKKRERRYPVDHDHAKKGRESVRGILHDHCNVFLGYLEISGFLKKAQAYLKTHA